MLSLASLELGMVSLELKTVFIFPPIQSLVLGDCEEKCSKIDVNVRVMKLFAVKAFEG
jgi:hypothetical protein